MRSMWRPRARIIVEGADTVARRPGERRGPYSAAVVVGEGLCPQRKIDTTRRDGVDGPLRHRLCQNEVVEISDKGAIRGPDYPHWNGYVEAYFSAARGGCRRATGGAQEAAAQRGIRAFCQAAAKRDRDGGLCGGTLMGAGVAQARPRGEADRAAAREGLRQAQQERRARRRGAVPGNEPADDAVRTGED